MDEAITGIASSLTLAKKEGIIMLPTFHTVALAISAAGGNASFDFQAARNQKRLTGIYLRYSDKTNVPGSTFNLSIGNERVFDENHVFTDIFNNEGSDGIAADDRFWTDEGRLDIDSENANIRGRITDGEAAESFSAYTIWVSFRFEEQEESATS